MQRILMPSDGSAESEKPLFIASRIAKAQGAEVALVTVVEEPTFIGTDDTMALAPDVYQDMIDAMQEGAKRGLSRLQARLEDENVKVSSAILRGHAAASLLDYEKQVKPDLVVMATHGRTGLARFAMGSVTDRLVREGIAPVLVTRMSTEPSGSLERALLMLDGSGRAEQALPLIESLAGKPIEKVTLYRVVGNPADRGAAGAYLEGVAARLARAGLQTEMMVDIGDPGVTIEHAVKDSDVVVLCTRGEGGFDRLRHGSIAEHVVRNVGTPTLLVRAAEG